MVEPIDQILGKLARSNQFDLEEQQRNAWINEIAILKEGLKDITFARVIFEYSIYSNSDPAVYEQVSKCWCKLAIFSDKYGIWHSRVRHE